MVDEQLARRGITDPRVLEAMLTVPRHLFMERKFREQAYADTPIDIPERQTISQPYIVARMVEAAGIESSDRVLEVGAGSGYAAAVCSCLARDVFSLERRATLAIQAEERLARLGFLNAHVIHADGMLGWPAQAPYDVILVPAASSFVPDALIEQLSPGGRLIIPIGDDKHQTLTRFSRAGEKSLGPVKFVPLVRGTIDA